MNTEERCENHRKQGREKTRYMRVGVCVLGAVTGCLLGGCASKETEKTAIEPVSIRIVYSGGGCKVEKCH